VAISAAIWRPAAVPLLMPQALNPVAQIAPGQGGVITRGEEKIAVWRDESGTLHGLSASCTHKGCTVTWNNADGTWDCPCHGSIFERDGTVIHGPARAPLPSRQI
jgi:Rieske Fe-S protein